MIITAKLKCTVCGREWNSLINTSRPDWKEREEEMKKGGRMDAVCDNCSGK